MTFQPEHLIPSDVERIQTKRPDSEVAIRHADICVKNFTVSPYKNQQEYPIWLAEGLEILSEFSYHSPWQTHAIVRPLLTVEAVIESFNAQWDAALADEVNFWREDPEEYTRARNLKETPTESPEHPWGDEVTQNCSLWLSFTPYRVWEAYRQTRETAIEILDDELLLMARSDGDGRRIERVVEETFDKAVREAVKEGA